MEISRLTELGLYAVGFVVSLTLGIIGGNDFLFESKYFTQFKYSAENFAGLYAYTVLLPLAAIFFFMMSLMVYKLRLIPMFLKRLYFGLIIGLGITSIVKVYILYSVGGLLDCGVFCFSAEDDDYNSKDGYFITLGLILVLVLIPVVGFMVLPFSNLIAVAVKEFSGDANQSAEDESGSIAEMPSATTSLLGGDDDETGRVVYGKYVEAPPLLSSRTWKVMILVLGFAFFLPFVLITVMYFPSTFEEFLPSDIRSFALECYYDSPSGYSLGDAIRFKVGGACLKFWPDLQIYYFCIYATAVVAIGAVHNRDLRHFLRARLKYFWGLSNGELLLLAETALMILFQFLYWYSWRPVWNSELQKELLASERLARTMGQLANMVMGLLVLPIARNNMFTYCFGLGWESMLWFHQLMGDVFLVLVFIHMVSWCVYYDKSGYLWFKNLMYNKEYHNDNFTINLQVWLTLPFFITQGVLTMSYIRRHYFEVFYYSHHLFMALFLSTIYHANSAWYYLLPGLALWFLDRILRTLNAYGSVRVLKYEALSNPDSNVTILSYVAKPLSFPTSLSDDSGYAPVSMTVGQYMFVNVPDISGAEWHPFSVSSSPGDSCTTHHIKDMGPGTWTNKLYTLVRSERKGPLVLNVDGPYGSPFTAVGYRRIVLVAGGIGITAAHSVFRGLFRGAASLPPELVSIKLLWVMRDSNMMSMFKDTLEEIGEKGGYDGRYTTSFYVTRGEKRGGVHEYRQGRPDLRAELQELQPYGMEGLIWFCGPKSMGESCLEIAEDFGVDFENNSFVL